MARRILYIGPLNRGSTTVARIQALERLGHTVIPFDRREYDFPWPKINALRNRFPMGPLIAKVNAGLLAAVPRAKPDLLWFDGPTVYTASSIRKIKATGIQTLGWTQDAPFGPRKDGIWYQYLKVFRLFDAHCVFRDVDVERYTAWGLKCFKIPFTYDPKMVFPPPDGWSDADRDREVSYVGSPFEERPMYMRELIQKYNLPVAISGPRWHKFLTPEEYKQYMRGAELLNDAYREAIWKSKISLAFLTQLNEDEISLKAFEIAMSRGFLLSLRVPGHQAIWKEGVEAEYFSSVEECATKIRYYLDHPEEREAIARRGYEAALRSGHDNDTQLARLIEFLDKERRG